MQLMRERDVPANDHDRVFRYSRFNATLAVALLLAGPVALFGTGVRHRTVLPQIIAIGAVGLVLLAKRFLVARFRPSNWLVSTTESGVYVKFRSYLNYHFSADDVSVVFIPYREIATARVVRETIERPDVTTRLDGSRTNKYSSYQRRKVAELELTGDTRALAAALLEESARQGPREKRWYGSTTVRANHQPVMLEGASRIRIAWECVPGIQKFFSRLASKVKIEATASRDWSVEALQELDRPALERRIAELARAGRMREARLETRLHFAYDNEQTDRFIERLLRDSSAVAPRRETA